MNTNPETFTEILLFFYMGCILVFLILHADPFVTAMNAVSGEVTLQARSLTGK